MRLAREIVAMYHSAEAAAKAQADWQNTFSEGGVPEDAPTVIVAPGARLRDAVKDISMSELRRLVEQGAVSSVLSKNKLISIDAPVGDDIIRIGKHRFIKIEVK